ncbi:TetR/AcrR family transcriptional regulator [Curtobacterium sp. NPDC090217]|uniref:TetR/AcrR family transcriptional regulator n=1 Tax=Curtobacterium sp. NPDC090217 TaxID=3363970 RepID=UPI00380E436B
MTAGSPPVDGRRSAVATRARILDAATELFAAAGIRATSADRVIDRVGITKVTFYRHFRTKTDLAVAYLEAQADGERGAFSHVTDGRHGLDAARAIASLIGEASCLPGFRGCPFINAAAETPDPDDPVRAVVRRHREWMHGFFATIAADAGAPDPDVTAGQLVMLRDGAMVGGYLAEPDAIAGELDAAFTAVLDRSRQPAAAEEERYK